MLAKWRKYSQNSKFVLENISASEVSRIAKKLDKMVKEFLNRPIAESIPYLFLDASYFKVRTDGRFVNKALLVVTGIHEDGYREILSAEKSARVSTCHDYIGGSLDVVEAKSKHV